MSASSLDRTRASSSLRSPLCEQAMIHSRLSRSRGSYTQPGSFASARSIWLTRAGVIYRRADLAEGFVGVEVSVRGEDQLPPIPVP